MNSSISGSHLQPFATYSTQALRKAITLPRKERFSNTLFCDMREKSAFSSFNFSARAKASAQSILPDALHRFSMYGLSASLKASSYSPYTGISAPISRSGMVQKLMRLIGPSVSTFEKYRCPSWTVVDAFQLNRMVMRSVILDVPTRVWPYEFPGSKARHIILNCWLPCPLRASNWSISLSVV